MKKKIKLAAVIAASLFLAACATTANSVNDSTNGSAALAEGYKFAGVYTQQSLLEQNTVYFSTDSYVIDAPSLVLIKAYAEYLKAKKQSVILEGYADERGTPEYNIALGLKRAQAVRQVLLTENVPANLINLVSYGETRPAVLGSTPEAYQKNRRVVFNLNK